MSEMIDAFDAFSKGPNKHTQSVAMAVFDFDTQTATAAVCGPETAIVASVANLLYCLGLEVTNEILVHLKQRVDNEGFQNASRN